MDDLDPMAERFAAEHKRFLEEHNPSVLRGQSDQTSYLFGGGDGGGNVLAPDAGVHVQGSGPAPQGEW